MGVCATDTPPLWGRDRGPKVPTLPLWGAKSDIDTLQYTPLALGQDVGLPLLCALTWAWGRRVPEHPLPICSRPVCKAVSRLSGLHSLDGWTQRRSPDLHWTDHRSTALEGGHPCV
ncbi:Hypothetical predicted protein [Marmota monax]|uniref:Uncharacterized protein n=1 Tax=Marmota monax TaxID=9995 RepID=A0A5E4ALF3_MARMO|nr:hypothetical protein GHT09_008481 [Marmota monax]VTJ58144.1 Hypothetical predicted protein [Marmota monax]